MKNNIKVNSFGKKHLRPTHMSKQPTGKGAMALQEPWQMISLGIV